jgi:hypothetical protein
MNFFVLPIVFSAVRTGEPARTGRLAVGLLWGAGCIVVDAKSEREIRPAGFVNGF